MSTPYPRDLIGYAGQPPHPHWPGEARIAVNFVMNYEEGSEYNAHDDGFSEATLTVFGCALALERNPAVAAAIRESGWDVCSHGWRWIKHYELTEDEERKHIQMAVESMKTTIGERPLGWYCRYGPSVNTRKLIVEEGGFLYDSDAYNDELPYWVRVNERPHLVVPYSLTANDTKFGSGGFFTAEDYFTFVKDGFDVLYREGKTQPKMMSLGLHLRLIGHPSRAAGLERALDYIGSHPGRVVHSTHRHREALGRHASGARALKGRSPWESWTARSR
jgi:peptidoglycan/xylan/chitin deacetylase (PgdA/CDA1 family)